jgi:phage terminase large subunit
VIHVELPNHFDARPYQRRPMAYFDGGGRRAITVWHRRGGKDLTGMHQLCKMAHQRVASYWHIFPTAEQGRKAIWTEFTKDGERIMEQVFPRAIRKTPREWAPQAEMVVELKCGSIYRVLGSDRIEVVGAGPAGVLFSEYSVAKPRTWDLIRPMLREKDGWAWFNFTPRGKNHAWKLLEMARGNPEWFVDVKTLYETRAYDPDRTIEEERASGMPEDLIAQEYLCDFSAANVGSFWGTQITQLERRGGVCAFEPPGRDDVFTNWDLGKADDTAIWWWRPRPGGVDVLDHYASHGEEVAHYFDVLESRAERHGWRYRRHWLPHDARAKTLATRTSVLDQFMERYPGRVAVVPDMLLLDGIASARRLLGSEGLRIHKRCSEAASPKDCDGLEALRAYHREWDDEKKCFREKPVHDWSSHTADSFRYLATVAETEGMAAAGRAREEKRQLAHGETANVRSLDNLGVLDELWDTAYGGGSPTGRI